MSLNRFEPILDYRNYASPKTHYRTIKGAITRTQNRLAKLRQMHSIRPVYDGTIESREAHLRALIALKRKIDALDELVNI